MTLTGSATPGAGTDFTIPGSTTLRFTGNAHESFKDATFQITDDNVLENTETIIVTLGNAIDDGRGTVFIDSPSVATIFIEDETGNGHYSKLVWSQVSP